MKQRLFLCAFFCGLLLLSSCKKQAIDEAIDPDQPSQSNQIQSDEDAPSDWTDPDSDPDSNADSDDTSDENSGDEMDSDDTSETNSDSSDDSDDEDTGG